MTINVCLERFFDLKQTRVALVYGFLPPVYCGSFRPGELVAPG